MATLTALFETTKDQDLRNRMTAAGWNKAKEILVSISPSTADIQYAASLLSGGSNERIINGALVLLQENSSPTDIQIQSSVDIVIEKLMLVGI